MRSSHQNSHFNFFALLCAVVLTAPQQLSAKATQPPIGDPSTEISTHNGGKTLTVTVLGFRKSGGKVLAALHKTSESFAKGQNPVATAKAPHSGETELVLKFDNLQPGSYAVILFHDENDDGELATNLLGIPTEPYGISQNARARFGLPKFAEAKILVKEDRSIAIHISEHSLLF